MRLLGLVAACLLFACGGGPTSHPGIGGKPGAGGGSSGGSGGTSSTAGRGGSTVQGGGAGGAVRGSGGRPGTGGVASGGRTGEGTGGSAGAGGHATGGTSGRDGGRPDGGSGDAAQGRPDAAGKDVGAPADGRGTEAGGAVCDISAPPGNVAAWIDESWAKEGKNNITSRKNWLADSAMMGKGQINICVRYGATKAVSTATRDGMAPAMQRWFNRWFALLYPYDCFPYPEVAVRITGWAVKPGQESLLGWTDRTVPVYTEISDGSDQAKGEPKCPDACGYFFHPDHVFSKCDGGADNHFDYTLWLDDTLPSGNAAEGSDWGVRMPVASFMDNIDADAYWVILHEIGHAFALSDYYSWTGSKPTGGSIMIIGSSDGLTVGDQWMVRRYWKETKALRYP